MIGTYGELAPSRANGGVIVGAELDGRGTADQAAFAAEQARRAGRERTIELRQPVVERTTSRVAKGNETQGPIGAARHRVGLTPARRRDAKRRSRPPLWR